MRILSIDYGKKRTGLAVTDPLQIIANGLATVSTHELLAHRAMIDGGVKKKVRKENKGLVDEISATIILQDYLQSRR